MKFYQSSGVYKSHNDFGTHNGKLVASSDPRKENMLREIRYMDHSFNQKNQSNGKSK